MIITELKKILFKDKGLLKLVVVFMCYVLTVNFIGYDNNQQVENNLKVYKQYVSQFNGKLTDEKFQEIQSIYDEVMNVKGLKNKLKMQFVNGEVTAEQFTLEMEKISQSRKNMMAFKYFYNQVEYVRGDQTTRDIIDPRGWDSLLDDSITIFFILIALAMVITPQMTLEYESEMDAILLSTSGGRFKTFLIKMGITFILCIFIVVILTIIKLMYLNLMVGLSNWNSPIQSLKIFSKSSFSISLKNAFFIQIICRILGAIFLSAIIYISSILTKKTIIALFNTFAVILIPLVGFGIGYSIALLPLPVGLLIPHIYFIGWEKQLGMNLNEVRLNRYTTSQFSLYLGIIIIIIVLIYNLSYYFYLHNEKLKFPKFKVKKFSLWFVLLGILLSGCNQNNIIEQNSIIISNQEETTRDENEKYFVEVVDSAQIEVTNKLQGESYFLIRDPFVEFSINTIFLLENNCYYSVNNGGRIEFYQVNLDSLEEKLIYYSNEPKVENYLNSNERIEEDMSKISKFYVSDNVLYYITVDYALYKVDLSNKKVNLITNDVLLENGSVFFKDRIFYCTSLNKLAIYDTKTSEIKEIDWLYVDEFKIEDNSFIYVDFVGQTHELSIDEIIEAK